MLLSGPIPSTKCLSSGLLEMAEIYQKGCV
jgi:hypothetical protein